MPCLPLHYRARIESRDGMCPHAFSSSTSFQDYLEPFQFVVVYRDVSGAFLNYIIDLFYELVRLSYEEDTRA
jgi:hypothetical protein